MDSAWLLIIVLRSFLVTVMLPSEDDCRDALRVFQNHVPATVAQAACLAQQPLTR